MNPQSASDNPESSSQTVGGVGRRLGTARQARGLDLERIAALLHLKPALVESLEQERYGDLPEPVFIAGYIRNYARHVGLDPEPLVAAYQASEAHKEPDRRWSEGSVEHNSGGGGGGGLLVRLVSIVLVAGLAYLFIQWWQGRAPMVPDTITEGSAVPDPLPAGGRETQANAKPESLAVAPAAPHSVPPPAAPKAPITPPPMGAPGGPDAGPVQGSAAATATAVVTPGPAQGASPESEEALPVQTPAVQAAAADVGTQSQVAGEQGVVLEFRGPCWVDVRDAAKTFSLKGEMGKGDRRVLGGTPPYDLKLGNAAAVAITVNGVPFDIGRVARTNSPRFKLDPTKPQ